MARTPHLTLEERAKRKRKRNGAAYNRRDDSRRRSRRRSPDRREISPYPSHGDNERNHSNTESPGGTDHFFCETPNLIALPEQQELATNHDTVSRTPANHSVSRTPANAPRPRQVTPALRIQARAPGETNTDMDIDLDMRVRQLQNYSSQKCRQDRHHVLPNLSVRQEL